MWMIQYHLKEQDNPEVYQAQRETTNPKKEEICYNPNNNKEDKVVTVDQLVQDKKEAVTLRMSTNRSVNFTIA